MSSNYNFTPEIFYKKSCCPFCGREDWKQTGFAHDLIIFEANFKCRTCDNQWTQIFELKETIPKEK